MDTRQALLTRRSIRIYENNPVPDDKINEALKAAMYAPNAFNTQPWDFIVVKDSGILSRIIKAVPYAGMLSAASCAIIICGDLKKQNSEKFLIQDCSAAAENILLSFASDGIGTCWIASYGVDEVVEALKKLFKLPDGVIPAVIISVGYPGETPEAGERFDSAKIHLNNW